MSATPGKSETARPQGKPSSGARARRADLSGAKALLRWLSVWAFLSAWPVRAFAADYPPLAIGPGDLLTITVFGQTQLPTEYLVDMKGRIVFPFLGTVKLAGLSQVGAGQLLARKLTGYLRYPQVNVLIKDSKNYDVSVLGQVYHPGKFLIGGRPTLLAVLAEAGGPLENADLGGAILIHAAKKKQVNLNRLLCDEGDEGKDPLVYPGDVLMVPKRGGLTTEEMAIVASILSSVAVIVVTVQPHL